MKEIYQQTVEEVFERVNGKKPGLTSEQVKRSREKCGWNELTEGKKKGILQILFLFFKSAIYQNIDVIQNRVCHIRDITAAGYKDRYPGTGSVCTVRFHDLANVHKYLFVSEC